MGFWSREEQAQIALSIAERFFLHQLFLVVPIFFIGFLFPSLVHGHGFANYAQGAKATAMGGAFTAIADDPTANYYNPAGIAFLEGTRVMLGSTLFTSKKGYFESAGVSNMPGVTSEEKFNVKSETNILPFIHFTHATPEGFGLGFSGYSMWGQKNSWPDYWEGRFTPGGLKSEISSYRGQAVMAYAPDERVSFSAGVFYQWIDVRMSQKLWLPMLMSEFDYSMDGSDDGLGWIAGILFKPHENLSLGVSYRSRVSHELDAMNIKIKPEIPAMGIDNARGTMRFTTPAVLKMGTALTWEKFTVAFDVYWTEWSVQDKIKVKFNQLFLGVAEQTQDKKWNNTITYGFGLEYAATDYLSLRAGYIYDPSPVPSETLDPMVFSGDSQLFCFGMGLEKGRFGADLSYSKIISKDRRFDNRSGDLPNPGGQRVVGDFKNASLDIFIASLVYRF